jgi:orotidine-5'-phosphate decarboxylase
MQSTDRLVVALDRSSRDEILSLADALHGVAGMLKIGLQAFVSNGPELVRELVARGEKVFLDLKIHDIPNTAQHAVEAAASLGASFLTVHTSGGLAMLEACANVGRASARPENADALKPVLHLLGVTILTSFDDDELHRVGFAGSVPDNATRLALLAREAGLRGVVASPHEIEAIRKACGTEFVILTPGIRPEGSNAGDQRRTKTPAAAIAAGADYIVVGRPITDARDPRAAAMAIVSNLS